MLDIQRVPGESFYLSHFQPGMQATFEVGWTSKDTMSSLVCNMFKIRISLDELDDFFHKEHMNKI